MTMASTKNRTTDEIRLLARNFARTQRFTDKSTVLKFYQQSLKDTQFNRIGIRVYDLAELVGEKLGKASKDVTFGDFKTVDYSLFNNVENIGPGTFACLAGLRQGVADNEKDGRAAKAEQVRAEQQAADTQEPESAPQTTESVPQTTDYVDSSHYDLGHTAGQVHAYLNVLKVLGGMLTEDPESANTTVAMIKIVVDMHSQVTR